MTTTEFFLDDVKVKDPLNIGGFFLVRAISERANGNLYDMLGRIDNAELRFNDPDAAAMLIQSRDSHLTEAASTFTARRNGHTLFSTNIDYATMKTYRDGSVGVNTSDYDANVFIQNIDKKYSIELPFLEVFSSETVYTDYSLKLDSDKASIALSGIVANQRISPVFKFDEKATLTGSLLEIQDFDNRPFYKNDTGQNVRLNMSFNLSGKINPSGNTNLIAKILIRDSTGAMVYDLELRRYALTAGESSFLISEENSLDVPNDATVSFVLQSTAAMSSLVINLDSLSYVDLSEGDLANISIPVVPVNDALAILVNFASGGLLSLTPYARLSEYRLSTYAAIRGKSVMLNISFGELWDDLRNIFCLRISKQGNKIVMESYEDAFLNVSAFELGSLIDYVAETDFEYLYSKITTGFAEWKPDNDAGVPERTAPMVLETALKSAPSELDLTARTLCASLKIVSEAYLKRNRPGSQNENMDKDERPFILTANPDKFIDSTTALKNWASIIGGYHGVLNKTSGEGAYMNGTYSLNLMGISHIFTPERITISLNLDTEYFPAAGDFVKVIDRDQSIWVYVTEGRHYPATGSEPDSGNTAFTGRIINSRYAQN